MHTFFRNTLIAIFCLYSFGAKAQNNYSTNQLIERLFDKLSHKQYFDLRKIYENNERKLPSSYSLFFGAYIDAAFNAPEESNKKIIQLLKFPEGTISPEDMLGILSIQQQNYIHLFQYQDAWQTGKFITSTYKNKMDSESYQNYCNSEKIWEALMNTPKQDIEQDSDVFINFTTDKSGLHLVDTQINQYQESLVFDTGANFSVLQRSVAKKLKLNIMDVNFQTTTATGKKVNSDLAVIPKLNIGEISIKNAVFIIFDDEDLRFASTDYEIKGIIGFPVIRALKEIHVNQNNTLFIPKEAGAYANKNLALDGLTPIIEVKCDDVPLAFHFDTGANLSSLYPRYYEKYKGEINKKYTLQTFSTGSVGGYSENKGYVLKKINLSVNDNQAKLKHIRLTIDANSLNENVYGNLGQDFISQFKEYVISFKSSCLFFK
ncbi:MAG: pepsin/retropepsin-like aspartic protease family protein [Mangrovibacterium sp.]